MKRPKRILVTRTDRLGDVVLSTPVIRFLREYCPSVRISFMVGPNAVDVVGNDPYLDEVIVYDKKGKHKGFLGMFLLAIKLRFKRFDTAIALHPETRIHMLFFLAGIPSRIGYDRKLGFLLTERIPHHKQEGLKHEVDYNFDLLRKAGYDTKGAKRYPYMITGGAECARVDAILEEKAIKKEMIAVHAGASCASKLWSPERFANVCDILGKDQLYDILIVGGKGTESLSKEIMAKVSVPVHDLTGRLTVGELAEILARCRLFISNDSGPVHVAVAVGTPVISIFGRNLPGLSPRRWGPIGERDVAIHRATCAECLAHNCRNANQCLLLVTVDEVVKAAWNILRYKKQG
jgi:lipopolysaccharide heptosyltransferase II